MSSSEISSASEVWRWNWEKLIDANLESSAFWLDLKEQSFNDIVCSYAGPFVQWLSFQDGWFGISEYDEDWNEKFRSLDKDEQTKVDYTKWRVFLALCELDRQRVESILVL